MAAGSASTQSGPPAAVGACADCSPACCVPARPSGAVRNAPRQSGGVAQGRGAPPAALTPLPHIFPRRGGRGGGAGGRWGLAWFRLRRAGVRTATAPGAVWQRRQGLWAGRQDGFAGGGPLARREAGFGWRGEWCGKCGQRRAWPRVAGMGAACGDSGGGGRGRVAHVPATAATAAPAAATAATDATDATVVGQGLLGLRQQPRQGLAATDQQNVFEPVLLSNPGV